MRICVEKTFTKKCFCFIYLDVMIPLFCYNYLSLFTVKPCQISVKLMIQIIRALQSLHVVFSGLWYIEARKSLWYHLCSCQTAVRVAVDSMKNIFYINKTVQPNAIRSPFPLTGGSNFQPHRKHLISIT